MPRKLLRTLNMPPVSAASPSPPGRALPGSSSSPRAEPSSQSRALWPSCRTLPAVKHKLSRRRGKEELSGPASYGKKWHFTGWFMSGFLLWAYPLVCLLIRLWASSSPSETGCSSTPHPAFLLTPAPPLSAPVAPAERFKKIKTLEGKSPKLQATFPHSQINILNCCQQFILNMLVVLVVFSSKRTEYHETYF